MSHKGLPPLLFPQSDYSLPLDFFLFDAYDRSLEDFPTHLQKMLSLCCEICYNITDRPVNPGIPGSGILRVRGKGPCGFRKTGSILNEVKKRGERCLTNG